MPETTSAALIFLNWRTPDLTIAAVRSARASVAAPGALRILVVDNGSGDDSVARFARELSDVERLDLPRNQGFARAMNAALARVREPIAFLLNSDLEFHPGALERLSAALLADPAAALACPKLLRPDGSVQPAVVPEPRLLWELTNRSLPRHWLHVPATGISVVPSVVGPCMAVHMERLRDIGFLDERFFFFFEETDWCRRIRQAGRHILYVPEAEVVHLQGESANRRPIRARVQFSQSRLRYFYKHGGPAAAALLWGGMLLRLLISVLLETLHVLLTLGRRRARDRFVTVGALLLWHLLLCRPYWGFEPAPSG